MARELLRVEDASNQGMRDLRAILRTRPVLLVARKIKRDPSSVRRWARGERTPDPSSREVMEDELGIIAGAWEVRT